MTNSELLKAWYTEVWEKGNTDAIDDFYAPGTNAEELIPNLHVGIEELRDLVVAFRHLLGEIKVNLTKTVEENDWVSAVYEVHTSRADNKEPIYVTGHVMSRIRDGKSSKPTTSSISSRYSSSLASFRRILCQSV